MYEAVHSSSARTLLVPTKSRDSTHLSIVASFNERKPVILESIKGFDSIKIIHEDNRIDVINASGNIGTGRTSAAPLHETGERIGRDLARAT